MIRKLPIAGALACALLLPLAGYTADNPAKGSSTSAVPANANETADTPGQKARPGKMRRSDHPIDDSVITSKVKAKFVKDKQIRGDNIEIKTVNGVVELAGSAKSKAHASRAVSLARSVKGVKSVKNDIQIS